MKEFELFTVEDFYSVAPTAMGIMPREAKEIANAKVREWLRLKSHIYLRDDSAIGWVGSQREDSLFTHKAILVCIEPLEQDSERKVLEDLIKWESGHGIPAPGDRAITIPLIYFERARKLLEGK